MRVWDAAGGDEHLLEHRCVWPSRAGLDRRARAAGGSPVGGVAGRRRARAVPGTGGRALEQDADHAALELDSGTRLRARLVLAADGGDSKLRWLASASRATPTTTARTDFGRLRPITNARTPRRAGNVSCRRGTLRLSPYAHGGTRGRPSQAAIVWTLPEAEATPAAARRSEASFPAGTQHRFCRHLGGVDCCLQTRGLCCAGN